MKLTDCLRQETRTLHQRLEQLPFAAAMVQGHVSRRAYGMLLGQLYYVHQTMEAALEQHTFTSPVYQQRLARGPIVLRDLNALGLPRPNHLLPETAELIACFHAWADRAPHALLGALYVFEGSRLGSMHLIGPLSQALAVAPELGRGLDYHLEGMAGRIPQWKAFQANLEAAANTEEQIAFVLEGATATFAGLCDLYAALEPGVRGATRLDAVATAV